MDETKTDSQETKTDGGETQTSDDWSEREIGALWRKGDDKPFYSGSLSVKDEKTEIVIFQNKFKEKDNQPDLRIYKSKALQN